MIHFLHFLDNNQFLVTGICLFLFICFLLISGSPLLKNRSQNTFSSSNSLLNREWFYFSIIGLTILFARLPILFYQTELNVDESLLLTEALTIKEKLFFWKYIDPTTHGPFDVYPLILASLGGGVNYITLRFTWFFCVIGIIIFTYLTQKELFNQKIARISLISLVFFFGFYKYKDFNSYSSEHIPLLLLGIGIYLLAKNFKNDLINNRQLFSIGLLMGIIPFAKLQAIPIAAFVGFSTLLLILNKYNYDLKKAVQPIVMTIVGGLTIPFLYLGIIGLSNSFPEFWQMYFLDNFGYTEMAKDFTILGTLKKWMAAYFGNLVPQLLLLGFITCIALILFFYKRGFSKKGYHLPLFFLVSLFIISLYCTLAPKRLYPHYLLFLIQPLSLLFSFILAEVYLSLKGFKNFQYFSKVLGSLFIVGLMGIVIGQQFGKINQSALLNKYLFGKLATTYAFSQENPTSRYIMENSSPDDPIVVWGYEPHIYVNSQRFSATPYHFVPALIGYHLPKENTEFHYKNFLQHFQATKPPIFVEAIGTENFMLKSREKYSFENFPLVAEIIKSQYTLLSKTGNVSIYVRKEQGYSGIKKQ